ncbi:MAG TPA: ABC transporter ATP-binding protein [Solirubrobacteraceae bacterium]|nr:ABC transporter ATP-binding protein [Solirubrobacteraceae bacterium]
MTPAAASLAIRGLSKSFGDSPVLSGLDLEVPAGTLATVLGPSGCGKTTLLRMIAGFEFPDEGEIHLGDRVLDDAGSHLAPERRAIGFLPQEGALFPHLDVAANVGFGLARAERRSGRVEELLALVGLEGLGRRLPHQLSGGQQQRVALARALAPEPGLVLLDEPFDALDAGLRAQVRADVRAALQQSGATALLVTHDQEEALSLADIVAVMRGGRIVQAADPQTLYYAPVDTEVAAFLGDAVLLDGLISDGWAETVLGTVPIRGAAPETGSATVMLRPEQISLADTLEEDRVTGTVVGMSFFGHDATARIVLAGASDVEILARATGEQAPRVGQTVTLLVEGSALAFAPPRAGEEEEEEEEEEERDETTATLPVAS